MRQSPLKSTLAVLRLFLGIGQKEFGDKIGKSWRTIQAIELGQLKLTEENAIKVCEQTGVCIEWLLKNNPDAPIIAENKKPYTFENYEEAQARLLNPRWQDVAIDSLSSIGGFTFGVYALGRIFAKAQESRKAILYRYRIAKLLESEAKNLGISLAEIGEFEDEARKLDSGYLGFGKMQVAMLERYQKEFSAITEKQTASFKKGMKGSKK